MNKKINLLAMVLLIGTFLLIGAHTTSAITWTEHNSTALYDWAAVTSSADGTKLAAAIYNGQIWTSTNSGVTWTNQTNSSSLTWSAIASSDDGTKLIAVPYSDHAFTSTNSGVTWTSQSGSGYHSFVSVTSSADGTKLAVGNDGDDIYTSNDSGVTWTDQTASGASSWYHIDSSSDGAWIIATNYGSDLFISNDSGVTWTDHYELGGHNWVGVAMSTNGSRIATATNDGYIYISDNYGNTWTNHTLYANSTNYLNGLAMSKDGSTIGVWQAIGNIFISANSGITWTNQTQAGTGDWSAIAFNNDGTKIIAAQFSDTKGDIWTANNPLPCNPSWTCNGYTTCDINNMQNCNNVTDANNCAIPYTGNYSEFTPNTCIYCTPYWIARTGTGYECQPNGTKLTYYDDYSTCCIDSPTNCIYPSDHNTINNCVYFQTDMNCQYDAQPYLTSKINFACTIPQQYLNYTPPEGAINNDGSVNCITYVRKLNQTLLIQSNPEYAEPSTLQFWKENERRQTFTNAGRIINAYYTDKLLQTGQDFILGMKCTTYDGTILTSEYTITPTYQPPTSFLNRMVWAGDNAGYIIIWILGVILIIFLAAWGLKKLRGR